MSERAPGSKEWWIETAMIAACGVALAVWLWDGPVVGETSETIALPLPDLAHEPRTLGDMLEAGCLTSEHLEAMRDGRQVRVQCPDMAPFTVPSAQDALPRTGAFP